MFGVPDPDHWLRFGPAFLDQWAAYLDLYPPAHVAAESLMIRHASALLLAKAGDSERVSTILTTRESRADAALAGTPEPTETSASDANLAKVKALAKKQHRARSESG